MQIRLISKKLKFIGKKQASIAKERYVGAIQTTRTEAVTWQL